MQEWWMARDALEVHASFCSFHCATDGQALAGPNWGPMCICDKRLKLEIMIIQRRLNSVRPTFDINYARHITYRYTYRPFRDDIFQFLSVCDIKISPILDILNSNHCV